MDNDLIRLFLPVAAGVVLGLFVAFRGFLRARAAAPNAPVFAKILAGLACATPVTKLFYAAILAFVAAQPGSEGVPRFAKADVFLVAGNVMGLMAFAQGFVAAARMPKMFAAPPEETKAEFARGFLGPSGRLGTVNVTMMLLGCLETPAIFAMIGGMIALGLRN
ncbi:MAG: hypothetical protein IJL06_11180 [Kiritimatiellae bacterium]|nr:hypothetical protein [Kiritimatiellia bacterium]